MPAIKDPSEIQPSLIKGGWTLNHLSAVPVMNGNSSPSGTATSSSNYSTAQPFWGFDNTDNTWTANGTTGWLKYDFGSGVTKTITKYSVSQGAFSGRAPYSWTLEGSNDDSNWTVLHTVTNDNSWSNYQTKYYTCSVTGAYRYYKINITLSGGASGLCEINKLGLYESTTEFKDDSGNGNDLTNNNTITSGEGFRQSHSANFNSANSQYLSIVNASQTGLNITGSLSFFCRFKAINFSSVMAICTRGGISTNGFAVVIDSNTTLKFYVNTTSYTLTIPYTLLPLVWYDLAVVFDSTSDTVAWYINGILIGTTSSATATITSNTSAFHLGANVSPGNYFNGQMEKAYLWSTVLTPQEIMSMSSIDDIFCLNTGGEEHLRSSASLNVKIAQTFTVQTSGWYDSITFKGYRNNSPTGNCYVTIEGVSGSDPDGTPIATSENLDVSLPATSISELNFRFANAVYLTAGTQYAAVIQGTYSSSSTVGIRFTRSSGGAGKLNGGSARTYNGTSWSAISTDDFYFRANRIMGSLIVSHFIEAGTSDSGEFFSNGNVEAWGQNIKFTSNKTIKSVMAWRTTYQNPTGNLVAKIYTNNAGVPGTLLATSAVFARSLGHTTGSPGTRSEGGYFILEFATPYTLTANTEYFLVIEATAGGDGSNFNNLFNTSGSGYSATYDLQKYLSGSWSTYASGYDMQFALFEDLAEDSSKFLLMF